MKKVLLVASLMLCLFLSALAALRHDVNAGGKTQLLPAVQRPFPAFINLDPLHQHAASLRASHKIVGRLSRDQRPAEALQYSLARRGLVATSVAMAPNGTLAFLCGRLGTAAQLQQVSPARVQINSTLAKSAAVVLALSWLDTFAAQLGLDQPVAELQAWRCETDELGHRHVRLQQHHLGVPVWANDLYVHINAQDEVYAVNGRYANTPRAITSTDAQLSADQALQAGRAYLHMRGLLKPIEPRIQKLLQIPEPRVGKAIWIDKQAQPHLVWQVDLYANVRENYTLFIDAQSGELRHQLCNTAYEGVVNASGTDLRGVTRPFRAYEQQGTYYLLSDVNELSGGAANLPENPSGGMLILDLQNNDPSDYANFYYVTSTSAAYWNDPAAVSALYNLGATYQYYQNAHGRRAIDDKASTLISVVNVTEDGAAMDNAYWNGRAMFWGNGNNKFKPLAQALDVAAHEYTHGVTEYSANLIYQDQSGALNEAISDFFGAMVDRDDWFMGEDIIRSGGGSALRDIANPGNPAVLSPLPARMSDYYDTQEDQGGVHTNCGIINRASYLIANQIGREKTERIYYRALKSYLTRQSEFLDARRALQQSATDLYSSAEVQAVQSAFDQVQITEGGGGTDPLQDDNVRATSGGNQWIAFVRDDQRVGMYNLSDGQDYYFSDVYVQAKNNNFSQFTATADGGYLYFVNQDGYIARLTISGIPYTYNYEVFDYIYVQQPGDIWNVAVTRDNYFLAFTSAYANDNRIYFLIGDQIYPITLELPSTQPGITRNTIQYPDVISWSPNTKYPRLAFDAYNEISLAGGGVRSWWSMGEIDLSGDLPRIIAMLPAQPDGVDAGNVQYSSTDPDVIIYSHIEANNWDIVIHDFNQPNDDKGIAFPGRQVQRPSFSPDDRQFVVDRFSDARLLICDIASMTLQELTLSTGARYPKWLVIGGNYDLDVATPESGQQPGSHMLHANYPNPFNAGTRISYQLQSSGVVRLDIFDLRGRKVNTLVDGQVAAGDHLIMWQGDDDTHRSLPSGVYYCQLRVDGQVITGQKMLLLR